MDVMVNNEIAASYRRTRGVFEELNLKTGTWFKSQKTLLDVWDSIDEGKISIKYR